MEFKDLFSRQSAGYARFRPRYPRELFEFLSDTAASHSLVWDCGAGNGQASTALAEFFDAVVATDPSAKQIESAEAHPKVRYRVAAEQSGLEERSCDLVTAAQAFHWFDQPAFYAECRRVLKPRGVVAIWSYGLCEISPEVDRVVHELYEDVLGSYWEPERRQVEQGYAKAEFPFEPVAAPAFDMAESWSLGHLIGFLGTWSALQMYIRQNESNPLETLGPKLEQAWGEPERVREVRWKIALRVGRV